MLNIFYLRFRMFDVSDTPKKQAMKAEGLCSEDVVSSENCACEEGCRGG